MRWRSLLLVAGAVLLLAPGAVAHVDPEGTLVADGPSMFGLTAHNDLDEPMTGFRATLPEGFAVVGAEVDGWEATVDGREVRWTGGALDTAESETFQLELEGSVEPGPVAIDSEQLYAEAEPVRARLELTAVPAAVDDDAGGLGWRDVLIGAALGVLTVGVVLVIRRNRSLQEK